MLVLAGLFSEVELILWKKEGWRPLNNCLKVPLVISCSDKACAVKDDHNTAN